MPSSFSHAFDSSCFTFVCLPFSPRLTWLADPALVTSVYPNRMQYTPRVLQEASLWDGVDAGVCGNGRRFSKTSSYPPCHRYAFIFIYPYFLMTSSPPLSWLIHLFSQPTSPPCYIINHSHARYRLCSLLAISTNCNWEHFLFMAEQCSQGFVMATLLSSINNSRYAL